MNETVLVCLPSRPTLTLLAVLLALPAISPAATSYTINNSSADAFVASGSPANPLGTDLSTLNFGAAGTLAIAPASSTKGEFDSVIQFNTAAAVSQFNSTYGAGNWVVSGLTLSLASNFGVQGVQPSSAAFNLINAGSFGIDWLVNNNWVEGSGSGNGTPGYPNNAAVSLAAIPSLLAGGYDSIGTYTYTPPGNNVYASYSLAPDPGLVAETAAGGSVSLYLYAADNQVGYLFNSRTFSSGHPEFTVTASVIPEPATAALVLLGAGMLFVGRRSGG